MDSITLRPIRAEDQPFLYEVYASTRQEELAPVPWSDAQKAAFLRMQFDAQHQHYQEHYTARSFRSSCATGNRWVGCTCIAGPLKSGSSISPCCPNIAAPASAARCSANCMDEADRAGQPLTIHVEHNNPALHWYERLGFRAIGDTGVYLFLERRPESPAT